MPPLTHPEAPAASITPSTQAALTPDDPIWRWALQAIEERVEGMLTHADRVRLGEDIEGVHDMRVGSRRLVAAMRVFGYCFPDGRFKKNTREAKLVTRELGAVRDFDVLIDYFQTQLRSAIPRQDDHKALLYLLDRLGRQRERARHPMLKHLRKLEESDFPARVKCYLAGDRDQHVASEEGGAPAPVSVSDSATVSAHSPFRNAARALIQNRIEEFYAFAPYAGRPEAVEELHAMRIAAKWLRYTMELFAPAYAHGLKESLSVIKRFQEKLGDLHDADVRIDLLQQIASTPLRAGSLNRIGLISPDPVKAGLEILIRRNQEVRGTAYADFYTEWCKQEAKQFRTALQDKINRPDG